MQSKRPQAVYSQQNNILRYVRTSTNAHGLVELAKADEYNLIRIHIFGMFVPASTTEFEAGSNHH